MNRTPALASSVLAVLGALATAVTGCKTGNPFPGADAAATDAVVLDAGPDAVMPDANPACVFTVNDESRDMTARMVTDETEREQIWQLMYEVWPAYNAYRGRAGRDIKVFVITPSDVGDH